MAQEELRVQYIQVKLSRKCLISSYLGCGSKAHFHNDIIHSTRPQFKRLPLFGPSIFKLPYQYNLFYKFWCIYFLFIIVFMKILKRSRAEYFFQKSLTFSKNILSIYAYFKCCENILLGDFEYYQM